MSSMDVKPISPGEVLKRRMEREVYKSIFTIINRFIEDNMVCGKVTIKISYIKDKLIEERGLNPEDVKKIDWVDIAYLYKKDWEVTKEGTPEKPESLTFIIP